MIRKTYFCVKCRHVHCHGTAIGNKHLKFNDKHEKIFIIKEPKF